MVKNFNLKLKYILFLFLFRLCPKIQEYVTAYFKSPEFLNHYQTTSEPLVKDLQTALDDDTFSKCLVTLLFIHIGDLQREVVLK